ncbi:MAG: hypothetical protein JWQ92_716 [Amnibacterium sp.]|nr:hypothetical protein [Amnibacterium sp.]
MIPSAPRKLSTGDLVLTRRSRRPRSAAGAIPGYRGPTRHPRSDQGRRHRRSHTTHAVVEVLTLGACALLLIGVAFQLGLSAGAPLAAAAYGGRAAQSDGRLPPGYRLASLVTAAVLAGIGWLLLLHGGLLAAAPLAGPVVRVAVWVVAALFALNTAGNLTGRHPLERWGMGAITATLTVLCVLLAIGG